MLRGDHSRSWTTSIKRAGSMDTGVPASWLETKSYPDADEKRAEALCAIRDSNLEPADQESVPRSVPGEQVSRYRR